MARGPLRIGPLGADTASFLIDGPWHHHCVTARGTCLHIVVGTRGSDRDDRPLVLLLHGFAQFWWAWRHVLPALDAAGWPVAALDLRGHAASDQPPWGYDPATLAADVAAVVTALGHHNAVVVGHDLGGTVGWAVAAEFPFLLTGPGGLVTVAAPPPTRPRRGEGLLRLPLAPQWLAARDGAAAAQLLNRRTAPGHSLDPAALRRYRDALLAWPAPQRAVAPLRHPRRRLRRSLPTPVPVDLLAVRGTLDRLVRRADLQAGADLVAGTATIAELPGVGHLPAEEDPAALTRVLLDWLAARVR